MDNNLREVNDDLMKEWFQFREETKLCNLTEEDKKHFIDFDTISERILKNVPKKIKNMLRNSLNYLIEISWIMFVIITRNIIGMDFVMVCS